STVGRLVAERAGRSFVDLDDAVASDAGESVAAIFASRGEAAFRSLEAAALRRLLHIEAPDRDKRAFGPEPRVAAAGPQVIALGGGALLDPELRREALARACVVLLTASPR